jgi:C-terminal processing protease CtpA/Prc
MKGDFVGIGVSFYMYKDSVAIIQPIANGPSAKAGIKAGDRILYADKTKPLDESCLLIVCFRNSRAKRFNGVGSLSKIRK